MEEINRKRYDLTQSEHVALIKHSGKCMELVNKFF
jgi:hypothetical protein